MRITRSQLDADGTVIESPSDLLRQARRYDPSMTVDELALARLIASEHDSGSRREWQAIAEVALNEAARRGRPLLRQLTGTSGAFGRQGPRWASTARDPTLDQVHAARAVLRGTARGISRGAVRFFDPKTMDRLHARGRRGEATRRRVITPPCDAAGLLEAWSYDYPRRPGSRRRCPPDRTRGPGRHPMAWVGPIAGVDAYRLMLMAPSQLGARHDAAFAAAWALIESRRSTDPALAVTPPSPPLFADLGDPALLGAALLLLRDLR